MRLYHFTTTHHLPSILREQRLRTTDSGLEMLSSFKEPSVVWFLDTPDAGEKGHGLDGSVVDKREIRITVDVPDYLCYQWLWWAAAHNIEPGWQEVLVKVGGGTEMAAHWWVVERAVGSHRWVKIENAHTGELLWEADHD